MSNISITNKINKFGNLMIEIFHIGGLFVISVAVAWSAVGEYLLILVVSILMLLIVVEVLRFSEKKYQPDSDC